MTTTFNATMPTLASPRPRHRPPIIAALWLVAAVAVAVAGCSMVKLGYGQAGAFSFRWLDRYVDFDDAQSLKVRSALDEFFVWHRRSQLPDYADLLARAEREVMADVSPERMCGWAAEIRSRVDTALERAVPAIADVASTLTPAQVGNVEARFRAGNEEYRDEHLQRAPERRRAKAVKREIERAEMLYGGLDDAQRELVARAVAASPADPEAAFAERLRRQQDALALVRRLAAPAGAAPGRDDAQGQVRAYLRGFERSPREGYRAQAERSAAYNCAYASSLHNSTSAAQRRAAVKTLKGYEADLRELGADGAGA